MRYHEIFRSKQVLQDPHFHTEPLISCYDSSLWDRWFGIETCLFPQCSHAWCCRECLGSGAVMCSQRSLGLTASAAQLKPGPGFDQGADTSIRRCLPGGTFGLTCQHPDRIPCHGHHLWFLHGDDATAHPEAHGEARVEATAVGLCHHRPTSTPCCPWVHEGDGPKA